MNTQMHAPLRYASDKLLRKHKRGSLDQFLQGHIEQGHSSQVVAADLAIATQGVIVIDRRTVSRWLDSVKDENR
jgi:hypothetical protein